MANGYFYLGAIFVALQVLFCVDGDFAPINTKMFDCDEGALRAPSPQSNMGFKNSG
jgi:hypothetical protein